MTNRPVRARNWVLPAGVASLGLLVTLVSLALPGDVSPRSIPRRTDPMIHILTALQPFSVGLVLLGVIVVLVGWAWSGRLPLVWGLLLVGAALALGALVKHWFDTAETLWDGIDADGNHTGGSIPADPQWGSYLFAAGLVILIVAGILAVVTGLVSLRQPDDQHQGSLVV